MLVLAICILLAAVFFIFYVNAAVYYEVVLDVATLLEASFVGEDEFTKEADSVFERAEELHPYFELIDSSTFFYVALGIFSAIIVGNAFFTIKQEFNASLEVELKRLNEYMKILASKQELKELALLECGIIDASTAGAYISKVNEISGRHGLDDFDNLFPIVRFLRRLENQLADTDIRCVPEEQENAR